MALHGAHHVAAVVPRWLGLASVVSLMEGEPNEAARVILYDSRLEEEAGFSRGWTVCQLPAHYWQSDWLTPSERVREWVRE